MELALSILMVLGIFVGIPAVIGLTIAGIYIQKDRRIRSTEARKGLEKELAQLLDETPVKHEAAVPTGRILVGTHQKR